MTRAGTLSSTKNSTGHGERSSLLGLGWVTAILAALHLADHAIRGNRVRSLGLNPAWDHSGWPFKPELTPYTYSLAIVALILAVGLWGTYRRKFRAGYWLCAAIVLGTIVTIVHFLPTAHQESPGVIYGSWQGLAAVGAAAVGITFAIVVALVLMAANAVRIGRRTRRWW